MISKRNLIYLLCCVFIFNIRSQSICELKNNAFQSGEELNYEVIYNWGLIWVESAKAKFSVKSEFYKGHKTYHLSGNGSTYPKYDWFYKVNDIFETYLDSETFKPTFFKASIDEGKKKDWHNYYFNFKNKKAITFVNKKNKPLKIDTVSISNCTIDVLTAIYHARNFDFSTSKINDSINISLIIENKIYPIFIRYLGKTIYTSKELGTFRCLKFSPLLIAGTIFKGGEGMTVWVTDDENKIPIYIEAPIVVGSIKVQLKSFKGLRHKLNSKINKKN